MKRAWAVAAVAVILAPAVCAQRRAGSSVVFRGTPASVTSIGGNQTFPGGVPASVTSIAPSFPVGTVPVGGGCSNPGLIPSALGCTDPAFTPTINFSQGTVEFGRRFNTQVHRRGFRRRGFAPVVVPYAYPIGYPVTYESQPAQPPVQIDIHIEDRRDRGERDEDDYEDGEESRYGTHYFDSREEGRRAERSRPRESAREREAMPEPEPPREIIPTVLIYRDGRREEVRNYAIVGKILYDFEEMKSHKVELAELDLPATVKANEERGVDFAVPKGLSD